MKLPRFFFAHSENCFLLVQIISNRWTYPFQPLLAIQTRLRSEMPNFKTQSFKLRFSKIWKWSSPHRKDYSQKIFVDCEKINTVGQVSFRKQTANFSTQRSERLKAPTYAVVIFVQLSTRKAWQRWNRTRTWKSTEKTGSNNLMDKQGKLLSKWRRQEGNQNTLKLDRNEF